LQDVPSLDALLTPVGGGGLMAGCATVAKSLFPAIQVFGVEADTANDTYLSFQKGERIRIAPPPTVADGIRHVTPGELTFPILREKVTEILLVSDDEIVSTVRFLLLRAKVLVEPTGAVAAAAVHAGKLPLERGARVGVVLSGGNVDPPLLAGIIQPS
jgi:threonine dehydratase